MEEVIVMARRRAVKRSNSRSRPRPVKWPITRRIDGKEYWLENVYNSKTAAKAAAIKNRREGIYARVVTSKRPRPVKYSRKRGKYALYFR